MSLCKDCGKTLKKDTATRCKSCSKKGSLNPSWNNDKCKCHCLGCGKKISYQRSHCLSCAKKGGRNPMYGKFSSVSEKRQKEMNRSDYMEWRKSVYERDKYTCQVCAKTGGRLNADHIKPWTDHQDLRYDISNGRTLCVKCHSAITREYLKLNWKNQFTSAKAKQQATFAQGENKCQMMIIISKYTSRE